MIEFSSALHQRVGGARGYAAFVASHRDQEVALHSPARGPGVFYDIVARPPTSCDSRHIPHGKNCVVYSLWSRLAHGAGEDAALIEAELGDDLKGYGNRLRRLAGRKITGEKVEIKSVLRCRKKQYNSSSRRYMRWVSPLGHSILGDGAKGVGGGE